MTLKKISGYIHLWLGLTSGLVVFVVALTGAILTFEDEIECYIINPELYFVKNESNQPMLSIDALMTLANPELLKLEHGNTSSRIFLYKDPERSAIVGYNIEETDKIKWPYTRGHVFLNPYTGETLGTRIGNPHHKIWLTITTLHIDLLLGEVGSILVTWGTFIFLIMVISGIILWWPKNTASLKQRYKFSWKNTTRWRRKNYDLHNVLGFYASWILIFMILTGLMWSFEWFNQSVYFVTSGGKTMKTESVQPEVIVSNQKYIKPFALYTEAYEAFKLKYPEEYKRSMEICIGYFAKEDDKLLEVSISFDARGIRVNKYMSVYYDKATHLIVSDSESGELNFGDHVQHATNELHYGSFFGLPSRIATFFACLIAASLPLSGFIIWYGRKKK